MEKERISDVLNEMWRNPKVPNEWEQSLLIIVSQLSAPENIVKHELEKAAWDMKVEFKSSTDISEDMYYLVQSPFDGKYYLFAAMVAFGSCNHGPRKVYDKRPLWFDEYRGEPDF
jgi:hypothetical protein